MLEAWSRTRDGTRKLSANFTVAENGISAVSEKDEETEEPDETERT